MGFKLHNNPFKMLMNIFMFFFTIFHFISSLITCIMCKFAV